MLRTQPKPPETKQHPLQHCRMSRPVWTSSVSSQSSPKGQTNPINESLPKLAFLCPSLIADGCTSPAPATRFWSLPVPPAGSHYKSKRPLQTLAGSRRQLRDDDSLPGPFEFLPGSEIGRAGGSSTAGGARDGIKNEDRTVFPSAVD